MTLVPTSENSDLQHSDIQLTLSRPQAEQLGVTLPWLLRALAERPTTPPQQRERRRKAYMSLEGLLSALSTQLQASAAPSGSATD